jgi:anaerobic magnesium-protoporphyrin IX monomethyl ester cyclase
MSTSGQIEISTSAPGGKPEDTSVVLLRTPMFVPKWAANTAICPALGLAYIAAAIRNAGFDVRCVDAVGEDPLKRIVLEDPNFLSFGLSNPEIVQQVGQCDVIGISLMFSHDWPIAKSIIEMLRQTNPNATIICGGEHVTAVPEFCLDDCPEIDICVLGEGEETIVEFLHALETKRPWADIPGIAHRSEEGPTKTVSRQRIADLDDIAWPAWDLFPLENYLANGLGYGVNPGRSIPLQVARGCPYQCTFCSSPQMWTTKWIPRSPDKVIEEMQYYIDNFGAQNFDWYDLTSIVKKDWIVEFCQKVIARDWNITWQMPSGTRSEALSDETLRLMFQSGQTNISYAPENGSPDTLKLIKKKIDLGTMKESIRSALKVGMNVKLNMIMGFPHEKKKHIFETLLFLKDMAILGVQDINIACFSPYPGSELFRQLQESGKIKEMDDDYFLMLTSYTDLRFSFSYSPHIGNRELTVYRLGGFFLFYSLSYLTHPTRFFRVIRNLIQGKEETRLDSALLGLVDRFRRKKISLEEANAGLSVPPR